MQPTSPLRTFEDINNALSIYESKQLESLISVCKVSQHPAECLLVDEDGNHQFINLPKKARQQEGSRITIRFLLMVEFIFLRQKNF